MKRLWFLGLLVMVAACSTKPSPPVAVQPVPEALPPPPPAETARLHDSEAAALAAYPDYARREGGKLVLAYNGRDVVRLTSSPAGDCEGWETCSLWSFAGMVPLKGGPIIVVRREHGEGENYVLFDRTGERLWLSGPPSVSPDGRHVANGQLSSLIATAYTEITAWDGSAGMTYQSETSCEPIAWTNATRLKLRCNRDDDDQTPPFDAEAALDNGAWKLLSAQSVAPFKPRPAHTAAQKAESRAWERKIGVETFPK